MRVVIEQTLFAPDAADPLQRLELFLLAASLEHALLLDPPWDPGPQLANTWLDQQDEALGAALRQILVDGQELETRLPSDTVSFRVAFIDESDWERARLSVPHALRLMRSPLQLMIEDMHSDWGFLRRIAGPQRREALDKALKRGALVIRHGGGLGSMKTYIEGLNSVSHATVPAVAAEASVQRILQRLRLWVMYDRDGADHDRRIASDASNDLLSTCSASASRPWALAHHQLTRRSIENYLPDDALWLWANDRDRSESVGRFISGAFGEHRRHCYDMKEGLLEFLPTRKERGELRERRLGLKNRPARAQLLRDDALKPPFQGLTDELRDRVAEGFGSNVARYFDDEKLPDACFERVFEADKKAAALREAMFRTLFARL